MAAPIINIMACHERGSVHIFDSGRSLLRSWQGGGHTCARACMHGQAWQAGAAAGADRASLARGFCVPAAARGRTRAPVQRNTHTHTHTHTHTCATPCHDGGHTCELCKAGPDHAPCCTREGQVHDGCTVRIRRVDSSTRQVALCAAAARWQQLYRQAGSAILRS